VTKGLRSLVAVVAVVGFFLVVPGETIASAQAPTITSVSPITAQNDSDLPGGEASGPGIIIAGSGFGATPPTVCQADNNTMLGESAIGRDVLTSNLQIVDTSHFSDQDMGNCSNEPHDDCDVTIGSWSDTQIIVLLDDTGGLDCDDINNGDNLTVQVFSTDAGNDASNVVSTSAVAEGSVASITGLSPASGPIAGGTFTDSGGTNPNGTITITGSNLAGTTIVWFGNGGDDGAVATTNFTFGTDGLGNPDIIVTPPPAPAGLDEGTDVVLTNAGGTSVVACTAIDEGCEGTYYWQSPSATLPTISGSTGPLDINASLAFNLAIPQKGACPGSSPAGGTGIGFSATATVTGGPVDFSGQFQTSENDGFLSSIQAPITVTVESPVVVTVNVSGVVSGCYAVPIPDLSIPGLGGVYILIGGNLAVGYTLTATINQGSFVVDAGYVANQVDGAAIVSQNCTDGNGHPLPCVQTSSAGVISGTLDFSPLWLGVDITDIPGLTFSAGAGLTVSAFVTDSTTSGFDYDVCFGGTYAVVGSVGSGPASLSISTTGVFVGPFNIYGDGTQCPLGAIGSGLPSTNVTVSSSDSSVPVGTKVTYTAAVSTGASGGTVSFADGGSPIASCESQPVDASGNATCDQTYSGTGSHSIVATFSGDTAFAGSVSTAFTQQVTGSVTSTTTTLASSANPSTTGQQVTYTATVSASPSGGTVSFTDDGTAISGCQTLALTNGTATCEQTYTSPASHSVVATYSGDPSDSRSTSATLDQVVSNSVTSTKTTLASSANPSTAGQSVTYTATVSPTDNGGPVTFTDGGTPISGCVSIALTNGTAGCAQTYAVPGTHSIVATYGGDTNFGESVSTKLTQVVKSSVTTTTTVLTSSANPSAETQQVTYTATVGPSDNGGTVSFSDGGTAITGCQSVALSAGKAECPQTYSTTGSLSIVATYSGDISYGGSKSATLTQVISSSLTATETTLVTSVNPAPLDKTVTYTATVSPTDNGGTVNFTYGGVALPGCTGKTLDSSHQATCLIDWVSGSGTTEIVATYSGDSSYAGSTSNAICQVVGTGARATATTLVGSANRATVGETVIYKATVSPASYGGTVTFSYGGGVLPGCKAVALNSAGQARCGIIWISGGTTSIVARYSGDTDYAPSTSNSIVQVVDTAFTAKTSSTSTTYGHAVALSVSGLAAAATGTVTFSSPRGSLCKAKVSKGKASCNTGAALVPGDYVVTAKYSGNEASMTATTAFVITKLPTYMTAKATPSSVAAGHATTLSASGLPAKATGTITFTYLSGTTHKNVNLCTATVKSGAASCKSPTTVKVGHYPVTATYPGNADYNSTRATTSFVIKLPTHMTAKATPSSVAAGHSTTLSVSGLPAKATGTITFTYVNRTTHKNVTLCTATVKSGAATCKSPTTLKVGSYQVTATYSGNADYNSTRATTIFTVK
jgi:hypothetical protein